jgi:hypothetical protein
MIKSSQFRWVCVALVITVLSACGSLPKLQSAADPTSLYVWPQTTCPSQTSHAGVLGAIGLELGTDVISGLVGVLASSLTNAAAADKNGYQMTTNSAVFYDYARYDVGAAKYMLAPPSCYVVAVAKPSKATQQWCSDPKFSAAVDSSCTAAGKAIINSLSASPYPASSAKSWSLGMPSLYAEIELVESPYSSSPPQFKVVAPIIAAIYYPKPLIGGAIENGKPRHLSIAITFVNPSIGTGQAVVGGNATDYFKGAAIAIDLLGITPGPKVDLDEVSSNLHTAWTTVPVDTLPADMSQAAKNSVPFKPISLTASLHEVGDPNVFLQAFAASFGSQSSTTAITNAIAGAVLPPTGATVAQNKSTYESAQSKYLSAVSTYQTACVKQQTDLADAKSGSSTALKSKAALPPDQTALDSAKIGADATYAAWQAAQLQVGGTATQEQVLHCP